MDQDTVKSLTSIGMIFLGLMDNLNSSLTNRCSIRRGG